MNRTRAVAYRKQIAPRPLSRIEAYQQFLKSKIDLAENVGFEVDLKDLHPSARPHQVDAIPWALRRGRALLGFRFGMGKTHCQLEIARLITEREGGRFLIVTPLGAKPTFTREDGPRLGIDVQYVRNDAEVLAATSPILITNYERVRDGSISPSLFVGISLDEGSILRTWGTKTTVRFMEMFRDVKYRFVATATPAPNRYLELINYAHFLGVMDARQARTRWFQRNSTKAHDLKLHPNQEAAFWLWVASWALFLDMPSDLGHSDEGYALPEMNIHWHCVDVDHTRAWSQTDKRGQSRLFLDGAAGVVEASREKRATIQARVNKMVEIHGTAPDDHWVIWHHLEDEREAITEALPIATAVYGSQSLDVKEDLIVGFSNGAFPVLATKPEIAGFGTNFQRFCHKEIFLGINHKFEEFIQAVYRLPRPGQKEAVDLHIIYAESESGIAEVLKRKWQQYDRLVAQMKAIIKQYGLSRASLEMSLSRAIGTSRHEERSELFTLVNNDSVLELPNLTDNSVGMIMTSIPFGTQYEYVASYNDFGHNTSNAAFFRQMDFMLPELFRVLQPGRVAAIHCKDRVITGKYSDKGIFHIDPFSDDVTRAFVKHGFVYAGRITITTDVVRENNQTYRLGWTEQCKDGSKMGVGMPEYIQLFRKPPTDLSNAYADVPVEKDKEEYTVGRWQIDAHSYWRTSGNRLLEPDEIAQYDIKDAAAIIKAEQRSSAYDYERHVAICDALEDNNKLPKGFMLVPPQSVNGNVWTDVVYARTLNSQLSRRGENHVCPLPFDIVTRAITRWSNVGDVVLDPFMGVGTVPYEAVRLDRKAIGIELGGEYFGIAARYLKEIEAKKTAPTLFDWAVMESLRAA